MARSLDLTVLTADDIVEFRNPNKPTKRELETVRHLSALGMFVTTFAQTEELLWMSLVATTGVTFPMAQAVMSGFRANESISLFRRALDIRGIQGPEREYLDVRLRQFGEINQMRNDILHYGISGPSNKKLTVSNVAKALHLPNRLRVLPVSVEMLNRMTLDLFAINYCFFNHLFRWIGRKKPLKWSGGPLQGRTWLYKPPSPVPQRRKKQKTAPKRPLRRGSSPAKPQPPAPRARTS